MSQRVVVLLLWLTGSSLALQVDGKNSSVVEHKNMPERVQDSTEPPSEDFLARLKEQSPKLAPQLDYIVDDRSPIPTYDANQWQADYDPRCCKLETLRNHCLEKVKDLTLTRLGGAVYYFHNDANSLVTWFGAQDFCRRHGMHLASIESAQENDLIRNRVVQLVGTLQAFFWTSLNDLDTEGTFRWAGTGQPLSFSDWLTFGGQPSDSGGGEDCGEVWQYSAGIAFVHWNDRNCLTWRGRFVCEMDQPCAGVV